MWSNALWRPRNGHCYTSPDFPTVRSGSRAHTKRPQARCMPSSTHKVARINRRSGEASYVHTTLYICGHTYGTSHPLTCMCSLELPQLPLVLLVKLPHHLSGRPLHRGMGRMGRQTPVTRTKTPAHLIVSTSPRPQPSWRLVREPPIQEVGAALVSTQSRQDQPPLR
jgi:hypothetical protein